MVFSSTVFLFIFLPLVLAGYYLLDKRFRNIFLLIMSLLFYAWGEPRFVFVMIGSIILNYIYALLVNKFRDKKVLAKVIIFCMIISNIMIFWIFKYAGFTISNVNYLLNTNFKVPDIALPIGISFFTFQAISYVIDVYYKKGEVQKNPLNVGLYISFFPQLIAGPIVRYETVADEIKERKESWELFCIGTERFVFGLGKKVLLSNSLAVIADRCFDYISSPEVSVLWAWLGAFSYSLQIYYDFSGYSDMAIGLGKMFGFNFVENFNYPYVATSITDFWRRWHISLSSWFRDYVYIPLGGSRVKLGRHLLNLFIVWSLTGIWHGASWNFIWWGWFYFVLLVLEKMTHVTDFLVTKARKGLYRLFTLLMVNFAWVLFRAQDLETAILYYKKMFGICSNGFIDIKSIYILKDNIFLLVAAIICAIPFSGFIKKNDEKCGRLSLEIVKKVFLLVVLVICISSIVSSSYNPFIYFNF